MTRREARKIYRASRKAALPDPDKLYERIENGICEKEPKPPVKKPKFALISTIAAAAACILILVNVPFAFSGSKSEDSSMSFMQDNSVDAAASEEAADSAFIAPENGTEYGALPLTYGEDTGLRGKGTQDELFCEDNVLSETSAFIDGVVENAYYDESGSVCYELSVMEVFGAAKEDIVTIESDSSIPMLVGREYLIPVKETQKGLETVVESVPQIEITLEKGAVFYNGWKSLDSEEAVYIEYDKSSADDFYYDRMKYTGSYYSLIEKWQTKTD